MDVVNDFYSVEVAYAPLPYYFSLALLRTSHEKQGYRSTRVCIQLIPLIESVYQRVATARCVLLFHKLDSLFPPLLHLFSVSPTTESCWDPPAIHQRTTFAIPFPDCSAYYSASAPSSSLSRLNFFDVNVMSFVSPFCRPMCQLRSIKFAASSSSSSLILLSCFAPCGGVLSNTNHHS